MSEKKERLYSLDVLRGLDMLLLTVIGPIVMSINSAWGLPPAVVAQFNHAWGGFVLWDIIMPLFIFMCGAAIPLALTRRLDAQGRPTAGFWKHILGRVVLLWFLGMLVQGQLLTFKPLQIHPYCNTLHSIAVGYFFTALVMLVPSKAVQFAIGPLLLLVYGLLLHFGGDYTRDGNFAAIVERAFYRPFLPAGHRVFEVGGGYTWVLTSLQFVAMTLAGYYSTLVLRSGLAQKKKAIILFVYGFAALGLAFALSPVVPIIKQIFTVSCTLLAIGWSVLALAVLYVLTDILKLRSGMGLVLLFGQLALTAYMLHSPPIAASLKALAKTFAQGAPQIFGATAQPFVVAVVECGIMIFLMKCWKIIKTR